MQTNPGPRLRAARVPLGSRGRAVAVGDGRAPRPRQRGGHAPTDAKIILTSHTAVYNLYGESLMKYTGRCENDFDVRA